MGPSFYLESVFIGEAQSADLAAEGSVGVLGPEVIV